MFGLPTEYYKTVSEGFVTSIGMGRGGQTVDAEAYETLGNAIGNRPPARDGYGFRLRDGDLTWEAYALPPAQDGGEDEDVPDGDALRELLEAIG